MTSSKLDETTNYYVQNVKGLKTETVPFLNNAFSEDCDIILLTETWMKSRIENSKLFDDPRIRYFTNREIM